MTTFTIQRSRWGYGAAGGALRNPDGKQCCLGFVCEQLGYEPRGLYPYGPLARKLGVTRPHVDQIPEELRPFCLILEHSGGQLGNTPLSRDLAVINDAAPEQYPTSVEREQALIKRAAQDGITFTFVD